MEFWHKHRPLLRLSLGLLLGLLFLRYLLPLILPLLLGLAAAMALSPLILWLQKKLELRRGPAAGLCVSGALFLLGLILYWLGKFLLHELGVLYGQLPQLLTSISGYAAAFGRWAEHFAGKLPDGAGDAFRDWAETLMGSGGTLAASLYERAFTFVSHFLSTLPDHLLFLLTMVLSCYFSAAELPRLQDLCREHLPQGRWMQLKKLLSTLKAVLGGYLRAQLKLMGLTFLILLIGFLLLRVSLPLFFALGIAVLDALPLFGTGTALLPWSLFAMISGDLHLGLGLLILYAVCALSRNVLEPKLLGAQLGVSPLLTLLSIYVGYRVSGFGGMLLLPILTLVGMQLWEARQKNISP
jgi:sporulation integral membrane protein YtvI